MSIPSDPTQEREWDEITEDRAHDDPEEDPGVVGHDAQHQHVAQRHLQHVEECLDTVQQPAEEERHDTSYTGYNISIWEDHNLKYSNLQSTVGLFTIIQ